jgi:Protein of unknown function (DUF998)
MSLACPVSRETSLNIHRGWARDRADDARLTESAKANRRYEVALVGVVLYVVLDVVAQLLPPHYSPISQAESDLAVGPYGYIMTINFLNRGILSLEFLFALLGTIRLTGADVSRYKRGTLLFGAWSVGALLLAVFPTDVPATPVSWHGAIHLVVAVIAFLGGAFGALVLSLNLSGDATLVGARRFALPLAILAVVFCLIDLLAGFVAHRLAADYGGLFERMFLLTVLIWIASISLYMLRRQREPAVPTAPPASAP